MKETAAAGTRLAVTTVTLLAACRGSDYLDADLRARVERLKEEAAAAATSPETARERADLLFEWGNALALRGEVLPVTLTGAPARVSQARIENRDPSPTLLGEIDSHIFDLGVKDEDPAAIGAVTATPAEPLHSGSWATLQQTYTVGTLPMAMGAVVLLGRQYMADQGTYQHRDPTADNYVSIRASNPEASWEKLEIPLRGVHGGSFRAPRPMPAFRLGGTELMAGETVTVVYGDRSGGSRGFRIQSFSTDQLFLPLYLDLVGKGTFLTPRWPSFRVVGNEIQALSAVAPSVVKVGEPFALRVRSEDGMLNRATGGAPAYRVLLAGEEVAAIDASSAAISTVADLRLSEQGVYRFEVRSRDGDLAATSNPVWARQEPDRRLYWGETHGHTGMAEGQGSAGRYYAWAWEDARLDFASLSEHDVWLDDAEWRQMQRLARQTTEEGKFVAFLGYEWSMPWKFGGHHNVFFRTPDRARVGSQTASSLPELYRGLHAQVEPREVLIIPHAHQPGDWTQGEPDLSKLVEIYSMHGTFEWFGNLYLKNGFDVGFVGASDDHRARPGYAHGMSNSPLLQGGGLAGVWAADKTVDSIFDALRGLTAYATSGPRIILDARLNGYGMGTRQPQSKHRQMVVRAMGTGPIDHIDVIRNGEVAFSRHYLSSPLRSECSIQVAFESSSEVFTGRDIPRAHRIWNGTLQVDNARVVQIRPIGLDNPYRHRAEVDESDSSSIHFQVDTRGRRRALLVELDQATLRTTLQLSLEPTTEYGHPPIFVRPAADLPAEEIRVSLADFEAGRWQRDLQVDVHTDRIRLQLVDPAAPLDQELEFTDLEGSASAGDYYYVRVTQLDGGRAWSSPFWVGERR